jgi:CubicO group peptidase (beta-lactamase class C family)
VQPFQQIEERATLRHLLTARSGIYLPAGNAELEALSPKRGSHQPGTYFQYQNWDFNAAGTAFEKLTGMDLFDALETELARPIGMEDFDRRRQRKIDVRPVSVHRAQFPSTRDMAHWRLMARQDNGMGARSCRRVDSAIVHWSHRRKTSTPAVGCVELGASVGRGMLWWVWDTPNIPEPSPARTARDGRARSIHHRASCPGPVVANQVFDEEDERQGRRIAEWRRTNTTPFCR